MWHFVRVIADCGSIRLGLSSIQMVNSLPKVMEQNRTVQNFIEKIYISGHSQVV